MPRQTVSDRLRAKLTHLLHKRGVASALANFSQSKGGTYISKQQLTYFLHKTKGRVNPLGLDDLDDLAAFFRCSIGQLVGDTKLGDLSGDEQRLIYGFRNLPTETREHFLILLEERALPPQTLLPHLNKKGIRLLKSGSDDPPVHPKDPAAALAGIRAYLNPIVYALATFAATGEIPHRPIPGTGPDKTIGGGVAD